MTEDEGAKEKAGRWVVVVVVMLVAAVVLLFVVDLLTLCFQV